MTKIALITGANKGIGFETAKSLGTGGEVAILVGSRDAQRGREAVDKLKAHGVEAQPVHLDVTDAESITAAAKWIDDEFGRLDILINNAGIAVTTELPTWKPSDTSLEVLRQTFETNVFGVVSVTNAMLPLLRKAPAARIVNVSSEVGSMTIALDREGSLWQLNSIAYPASKTALNMVTVQYAKELWDTPIKVNAVTPGYCATDLNGHSGLRTAAQGAVIAVQMALLGPDGPTGTFVDDDGVVPF